jgi:hypothetical protein
VSQAAALGSSSLSGFTKIQGNDREEINHIDHSSDSPIRERTVQDDVDADEPDAERRVMYSTTGQVRSLIQNDLSDRRTDSSLTSTPLPPSLSSRPLRIAKLLLFDTRSIDTYLARAS